MRQQMKNGSDNKMTARTRKDNFLNKINDYLFGGRAKVMYIKSGDERIMSFPWLIAILFLLVFDVPSWVIAILLLFLIIFDLDLSVESRVKKDEMSEATVKVEKYREKKTDRRRSDVTVKDGYYEFRI